MRVRQIAGVALLLPTLVACDPFYGPKITNAFGYDVVAVIQDDSGRLQTFDWPACQTTFLGSRNHTIQKIVFTKDGTILQTLTANELQTPVKDLKENPDVAHWLVDGAGIHRFLRNATTVCAGVR